MESKRDIGALLVFLAAVCYSLGGVCIKLIPWNGLAINGARTAIAVVVLLIYLKAIRHPLRLNRWILLGAVAIFLTNALFSIANKLTTASNTIVLQFTAPIFVMLFTAVFFRKKPDSLDLMACAAVFIGIVMCFVGSLGGGALAGNLLAVVSGMTYAIVFMMNELPNSDAISSVLWGDVISACVGLPYVLQETDFSGIVILNLLILGVVQVALGYIFLCIGLKTVDPVRSSLISGIEPVLNPIWVALFYGERVSAMSLAGGVVVVGSVLVYNILKIRKKKTAAGSA